LKILPESVPNDETRLCSYVLAEAAKLPECKSSLKKIADLGAVLGPLQQEWDATIVQLTLCNPLQEAKRMVIDQADRLAKGETLERVRTKLEWMADSRARAKTANANLCKIGPRSSPVIRELVEHFVKLTNTLADRIDQEDRQRHAAASVNGYMPSLALLALRHLAGKRERMMPALGDSCSPRSVVYDIVKL
jgi:hypothetical protein